MHTTSASVKPNFRTVNVVVTVFTAVTLLSGCSTYQASPGKTIADTPVRVGVTAFDNAAETFAKDLQASATNSDQSAAAIKAFRSGRAMLDLQCDRYLDAVGGANQAASNERKQVGLIGGFTSAIMGLTGSSAKQIAGVATTFSFAGSSMDAFTTAYLFSDAAKSVTKIVRESQSAFLGSIQGDLSDLDYPGTVAILTRYESVCRPAQIRALIDEAIAKGTVVVEPAKSQASDPEVASVLAVLSTQFGRPISETEAINLYAWYKYPKDRSTGPKTEANEPIASFKKSNITDETLEKRLSQAFLSISLAGSAVPARWEPAVQQIRKVPAAAVVPAPAQFPAQDIAPAPGHTPAQSQTPPPTVPRLLRLPVLTVR